MSSMDGSDAKVLSFEDVVLRQSDVDLLEGPYWLNDAVIAFFFEYASQEKYKPLNGSVLLLPGAITFLLATVGASEASNILEPLQVQTKSAIIFAVNDNPDVEAAGGGSHWSLLVYFCHACSFRHYDSSLGRASRMAAAKLHRAVRDILVPEGGTPCPLEHVQAMPQQENGYDCGIYILAMSDAICDWAERARQEGGAGAAGRRVSDWSEADLEAWEGGLQTWLTATKVVEFRAWLLSLIQEKQQQQQQANGGGGGSRRSSRRRTPTVQFG